MNTTDSRLTCERCHGTGYVSAVLSLNRQAIHTQGIYFRSRHQNQVYILDAHKERPGQSRCLTGAADRHVALVKPLSVFKNLEIANPVSGRIWASTRSNQVTVQSYFLREKHIITEKSARHVVPSFVISTSSAQQRKKLGQYASAARALRHRLTSINYLGDRRKHAASLAYRFSLCFVLGVSQRADRAATASLAFFCNDKPCIPFSDIWPELDLKGLSGNYILVFSQDAEHIRAMPKYKFSRKACKEWRPTYTPIRHPPKQFNSISARLAVSNHQEMSGEQG